MAIRSLLLFSVFLFMGATINAQNTSKGEFSMGVRSTGSYFSETKSFGIGSGGQFRFRINRNLNTEWFADWIVTDLDGYGFRYDAHIGESMMIYPFKEKKFLFTPYLLGGFCADYTKIISNRYFDNWIGEYVKSYEEKWSFATQLGLGTHYNISDRFDISLSAQYVLHFGGDIHFEQVRGHYGAKYIAFDLDAIEEHGLEGHLFLSLSANYIVFDFLKNK